MSTTLPTIVVQSVRHRPGVGGYVVLLDGREVFAGTFAECHKRQGEMIVAQDHGQTMRYMIAHGLAGYGPDVDEDNEPIALTDVAFAIHSECDLAADHAEESAHALAESGEYEAAWKEHERAESLATLARNFDPHRAEAPLYVNSPDLWLATVRDLIAETFPVYVSPNSALYVWRVEESDSDVA